MVITVALDWSEPFWDGSSLWDGTGLDLAESELDDARRLVPALCGVLGAVMAIMSAVAALVTDRVRRASDAVATVLSIAVVVLTVAFCAWDGVTAAVGAYSTVMLALMVLVFETVMFVIPESKGRALRKASE